MEKPVNGMNSNIRLPRIPIWRPNEVASGYWIVFLFRADPLYEYPKKLAGQQVAQTCYNSAGLRLVNSFITTTPRAVSRAVL